MSYAVHMRMLLLHDIVHVDLQELPSGTHVFWQYANCIWAVLSALPVSGRALRICFGDPFEAALRRNNHGKR